eukprot:3473181-Rhodomonas_salina.5
MTQRPQSHSVTWGHEGQVGLGERGAIEAVVAGMKEHIGDGRVQEQVQLELACLCLRCCWPRMRLLDADGGVTVGQSQRHG